MTTSYNAKLLVVEDDPAVSKLIRLALAKKGWHTLAAGNGREALEIFDQEPVDLVLMDLKMPIMDGFEATRQIRKRGIQIPVIALTAHARPEVREECLEAGMNDFLTKPVNMPLLYAAIERNLAQPAARP